MALVTFMYMNSRNSIFEDSRKLSILLAVISLVLGILGIYHHEMWRDETEAWMIARDSNTLLELRNHMTYQGHPMLWHLGLWIITRFTHNPFYMQIYHVLIMMSVIYLFTRYSTFPTWIKLLFPFGYYTLFEYSIISRNYSIALLLLIVFCIFIQKKKYISSAIVLGLVSNTNAFALIASTGLAFAIYAWPVIHSRFSANALRLWWKPALIYTIFTLFSAINMIPPPDCFTYTKKFDNPHTLYEMILSFNKGVWSTIAIPRIYIMERFWNSSLFYDFGSISALGIAFLFINLKYLIRDRGMQIGWILSMIGIALFDHFIYPFSSSRHQGIFLMIWLMFVWLSTPQSGFVIHNKMTKAMLVIIFVCQLVGGVFSYIMDLKYTFSEAKETAAFIEKNNLQDELLAGYFDYSTSPVGAYLDRRIYYPERSGYGTFMVWNTAKKWTLHINTIEELLSNELKKTGKKSLIYISVENDKPFKKLDAQILKSAGVTLVGDEHFYVYRLSLKEPF
jgi:hypothetical protein